MGSEQELGFLIQKSENAHQSKKKPLIGLISGFAIWSE
uniref:Uncharacterized protein n=1 Tax=Siphoviridae sp. ctTDf8 TaxID=2825517 RepID=A0A8S5UJ75_9CAUD|nr:MAG TPA: hypothetical protein [Siphoviridae sp. ctTDf8]